MTFLPQHPTPRTTTTRGDSSTNEREEPTLAPLTTLSSSSSSPPRTNQGGRRHQQQQTPRNHPHDPFRPPPSSETRPRPSSPPPPERTNGGGGRARGRTRRRVLQRLRLVRRRGGWTRVVVPIALIGSQIPYVWRTNEYYSSLLLLSSSGGGPINDASAYLMQPPPTVQSNNRTRRSHRRQESPAASSSVAPSEEGATHNNREEATAAATTATAVLGIVPPSLYVPDVQRPLAVRWIGGRRDRKKETTNSSNRTTTEDATSPGEVLRDGFERSRYLSIVSACWYDPDPHRPVSDRVARKVAQSPGRSRPTTSFRQEEEAVVTIVDWATLDRDCHVLRHVLSQCHRLEANDDDDPDLRPPTKHSIFVYWDTTNSPRPVTCPLDEESTAGATSRWNATTTTTTTYHYVRRSAVHGRHWNATAMWVSRGRRRHQPHPHEQQQSQMISGWHVSGHPLRELFVQRLVATANRTQLPQLPDRNRPQIVSCFHHLENVVPYSSLRRLVGATVLDVATTRSWTHRVEEALGGNVTLSATLDEIIIPNSISDETVPTEYVTALITSQMVVVANHDEWEGHWRLFESMASGAMVVSDAMLAPPAGLQNGTHAVLYDSPAELRALLQYYAEHGAERRRIAARGQELALGWHRSWHDVERVLFG